MNALNDLRTFINFNKPRALDAWLEIRDILIKSHHNQNPIDLTIQNKKKYITKKKTPSLKNQPHTSHTEYIKSLNGGFIAPTT